MPMPFERSPSRSIGATQNGQSPTALPWQLYIKAGRLKTLAARGFHTHRARRPDDHAVANAAQQVDPVARVQSHTRIRLRKLYFERALHAVQRLVVAVAANRVAEVWGAGPGVGPQPFLFKL